jgi:hypothetical protein
MVSSTSVDGEEAGLLDGAEFVDHFALVLTRVTQLNLLKKGTKNLSRVVTLSL